MEANTARARMPSTSFGQPSFNQDGGLDLSSLDWTAIAQFEARNVVDWIKFLLCEKRKEISLILDGILKTFQSGRDSETQDDAFVAYTESGLPSYILYLASDPQIYTDTFVLEVEVREASS